MPYTILNLKQWAATNNIIVFICKFFSAEKYKENTPCLNFSGFPDHIKQ